MDNIKIMGSMEAYYGARAQEYEEIYHRDEPTRQKEQTDIADTLKAVFQGRRVFEVACGTGYWTQFVAQTAALVVATDIGEEVLKVAKATKVYLAPTNFVQADAFQLPFKQAAFDGGLANFWFSHLKKNEREKFLDHFHSRLRSGARVFIADNVFNEGVGGELITNQGDENSYKLRTLKDGTTSLIIKNYPRREELVSIFSKYAQNLGEANIYFGNHFWFVSYALK